MAEVIARPGQALQTPSWGVIYNRTLNLTQPASKASYLLSQKCKFNQNQIYKNEKREKLWQVDRIPRKKNESFSGNK